MPEATHTLSPGLKKEASPVDSRIAVEPCVVRKGGDPLAGETALHVIPFRRVCLGLSGWPPAER
jgi:hypothetical protein